MLKAIGDFSYSYYSQIPENSLKTIGLSAISSYASTVIMLKALYPDQIGKNPYDRPLFCAGIAGVAAAVHALTTPIFNYLFARPEGSYNPIQEAVQIAVTLTVTPLIIKACMERFGLKPDLLIKAAKISFLVSSFLRLPLDVMFRGMEVSMPEFTKNCRDIASKIGINFKQSTPAYIFL